MRNLPDALVLCGGAGTRLRSVTGETPKSLAAVAGRPFLELLLRQLRRHGYSRVVMAVGYQRERIRTHFGDEAMGMRLVYSEETIPLGTGGALRNAQELFESELVLVMNGDSYTDLDLNRFLEEHVARKAEVSVAVVPADGRVDCGSVFADAAGRLTGFAEKAEGSGAPYLNAGIYLLPTALLSEIPAGQQVSLERELLAGWLREGRAIRVYVGEGACVDIGTPERFEAAQRALAGAEQPLQSAGNLKVSHGCGMSAAEK